MNDWLTCPSTTSVFRILAIDRIPPNATDPCGVQRPKEPGNFCKQDFSPLSNSVPELQELFCLYLLRLEQPYFVRAPQDLFRALLFSFGLWVSFAHVVPLLEPQ